MSQRVSSLTSHDFFVLDARCSLGGCYSPLYRHVHDPQHDETSTSNQTLERIAARR